MKFTRTPAASDLPGPEPWPEDEALLPSSDGHDPYAALRVPDYRRLLAVLVLVGLGGEMQAVAIGWELYERTHEPAALGYTGLAQFLPVLLLSLVAGHAADRYSRKKLLLLALALSALTSLGLAALSRLQGPVPLIYVCLTLAGVARAFSAPARSSLLPQLVPPRLLANAVAWNSSGWQVAAISGPALGGLVLAVSGRAAVAYLLAASCSVACAVLIAPVRPRPFAQLAGIVSRNSLLEGVRFVWRTELLLAAITLDLFAVLLGGATALLPIYASDILHVGPAGLGWLRSAPALGAVFMAVALAHRPPLRRAGRALLWSVAGFGAATIGFGLSRDPFLSFALLALTGALDNISVVVRATLMQMLTPDALRGRVAAVNSVFISSSNELGAFESGITAEWFGPVLSVVGGGAGTILVVAAAMLRWPRLLELGSLHSVRETGLADEETKQPAQEALLDDTRSGPVEQKD
jgi:MFS family permease